MSFSMRAPGLMKTFIAEGTITDGAVVVQGAADDKCKLPTGATSDQIILGVASIAGGGTVAAGLGVDVVVDGGVYPGVAGAAITRGDPVMIAGVLGTVKSQTIGVPHIASVGIALESAASGERVALLVRPRLDNNLLVQAFVAEAGITANTAVKVGTVDNKVLKATTDPTAGLVGVALNTVLTGEVCYVAIKGVVPVITQGNIALGNNVSIGDTAGGIKAAAPGTGVNSNILGVAVSAATAPATANILVGVGMMQGA